MAFKAGKSGVSRMCVCHRRGVLSREECPVPRHPGGVHGFYLLAEGLSDEPWRERNTHVMPATVPIKLVKNWGVCRQYLKIDKIRCAPFPRYFLLAPFCLFFQTENLNLSHKLPFCESAFQLVLQRQHRANSSSSCPMEYFSALKKRQQWTNNGPELVVRVLHQTLLEELPTR